ncbi:hypothetical protein HWB79_gp112 [Streptomyces phage LukeCage]|jgi:hypothetical protein|uniref:Uncharacterized protein n=1 Tax=Streptomyces phage LukeCage TaxID=2283304 RepID=A0A345MGL8_9CAUD|nr:hypothetical protein HWB79_gp112 [Streptomyces phage LukeCage]AXH69699.1 hypothetical protein SEA_LUKECAGE_212 [Streptomyces phage LukeCage]
MLPNPEKYTNIYTYQTREWVVLGTDGYRPETIKSGFKSQELAEAWMRVYLENYVKQNMLRGDEEYELS